jgi:hypothetical protein
MNNNDLAWKIYKALNDRGAGIGSASVPIIETVLDKDLAALQAVADAAKAYLAAEGPMENQDAYCNLVQASAALERGK